MHVDGGARGNPGPAAAGAVDLDARRRRARRGVRAHRRRDEQRRRVPRRCCSASQRARALGASEVDVVNDSELVARQVSGAYKVKHPDMKPLHAAALDGAERLRALVDPLGPARAATRTRTRSSTRRSTPATERRVGVASMIDALTHGRRSPPSRARSTIAFSAILVHLAGVSPSTAAVFRCAYALPVLALLALGERRRLRPAAARQLARAPARRARSSPPTSSSGTTRSPTSARASRPCSPTCRSCSSRSRRGCCSASARAPASRSPCRSSSAAPCSSPASSATARSAPTRRAARCSAC